MLSSPSITDSSPQMVFKVHRLNADQRDIILNRSGKFSGKMSMPMTVNKTVINASKR